MRPIADIFPHLWNGKRALVEWEEAEKKLLGANASPRTTVPPALFEALSAQVHAWKAQAVQLERDGAPAPGPGNHHGQWFDTGSDRWRDGPDPRQAPLEAVMALHGFSFKREAHAKALLVAVNGVCAEARKKEAKLLATEREARGPAGDANRLTVVTDTLDAMVRMCGLPRAEATDACVTAGVALLSRADEALAEGARAAQGGVGGRTAVKMPQAALDAAMAAARSGDLRSLLPHLIFTNGHHCTLNDHAAADALCLWASSADVAPAAEAHTMAILGALATTRCS